MADRGSENGGAVVCRAGGAMGEVLGKQDVLLRLLSELPAETLFVLGCVCKVLATAWGGASQGLGVRVWG